MRFPLYLKILCWLFLNLLVLAVAGWLAFGGQFRFGLETLFEGPAGNRIQAVADVIGAELRANPREKWDDILQRFHEAYHVPFYMFRNDGVQLAGEPVKLPPDIYQRLTIHGLNPELPINPPERPPREAPPRDGLDGPPQPPPPRDSNRPAADNRPPHQRTMIHITHPNQYWVFIRLPGTRPRPDVMPEPCTLITVSDRISGGGLFFDPAPWLEIAGGAILLSALVWLPLVRGITRFIRQMTKATEQIAEGRFDVRVGGARRDELGSLGGAINRMAARLAGFVSGQKRFLGDIAHELCSPLARMQVALSILEQMDASEKHAAYVADVREEVEHMSSLVNELLSFSKAALGGKNVTLKPVPLAELAHRIVGRENKGKGGIVVNVPQDFTVMADPELLARAVGNVVRNAIRYANPVSAPEEPDEETSHQYTYKPKLPSKNEQPAGPLTLTASKTGRHIILSIADNGPGIPESAIAQIFDPFYRVDTSRARETGGAGLGLAIVKTCVESCGGSVTARNRQPNGLEVIMTLQEA